MKVMGEKGLGNILKVTLQICLSIGITTVIILPFVLNKCLGLNLLNCFVVIYPNGVILSIITYKFIKLFNSLTKNNPFCVENVKILKTTGIVALIGSVIWIFNLIFEIIVIKLDNIVFIATLIFLCILYFGVSIALYVLSELFKKATEYKEENELTI
ncbi:MAG: DUF2975 domain-containing protein [Clostridia bacterium]|nr:DUF2975 domain-containing protein [Clostridia bacterium]